MSKRIIAAALAGLMLAGGLSLPAGAQGFDRRDTYIERWYDRNGRDADYRDWRNGRFTERDYRRWYRQRHREDRRETREDAAAALFGLGVGALLGGAAAGSQGRQVPTTTGSVAPPAAGYPAGSEGYLRYCESKYRSFDPATYTFMANDGRRYYCR